jgi:hypothetical protein
VVRDGVQAATKVPITAAPDQEIEGVETDAAGEDIEVESTGSGDEEDGAASSIEKETDTSTDTQSAARQVLEPADSVDKVSPADVQDPVVEREVTPRQVATPQELHEQHINVGDWLGGGHHVGEQPQLEITDRQDDAASEEPGRVSAEVEAAANLWADWPSHLEERRRIWFEALKHSVPTEVIQPVVYWLQNCFRTAQSNFALEAAIMLARRLDVPLVVVTLVRASVIYPVRHAQTASDAYLRWSLLEVQNQCARANVAFHGITAAETINVSAAASSGGGWERHQLVTVLDEFQPLLVVTDMAFDVTGAREMVRMAHHLELSRPVSSWSLVSIDSSSYAPVHNVSLRARGSLERKASFLSEGEFGQEYAAALARFDGDLNGAAGDSQLLRKLMALSPAASDKPASSVTSALHTRGLELVDWAIVRGMADESSSGLPTFTERAGLKALNTLLAEVDHRPAIQAELQVSELSSLLRAYLHRPDHWL